MNNLEKSYRYYRLWKTLKSRCLDNIVSENSLGFYKPRRKGKRKEGQKGGKEMNNTNNE